MLDLRKKLIVDIIAVLRRHYKMFPSDFPPTQILNTQISVLRRIANEMCADMIPYDIDHKEKDLV